MELLKAICLTTVLIAIISVEFAFCVDKDLIASNTILSNNATDYRLGRVQRGSCFPNPCGVYGLCYLVSFPVPIIDRFYCVCSPGFAGELCTEEINECEPNPCMNGAVCFDYINAFFCSCPPGFSGQFCEIDLSQNPTPECRPESCGDGECVKTTNPDYKFACKCKDGTYKFEACVANKQEDKCATKPCGLDPCINAPNSPTGYICRCSNNKYSSVNCRKNELCKIDSCLNNGTCVLYDQNESWCNPNQVGKTCCQCVTGFTGQRCETEIDECQSQPCLNGGVCKNLINMYKCECPSGLEGYNCERKIPCASNPCKFGGTCMPSFDGSEMCKCKDGFTGKFCEIDINECDSSPCQNGGTCIDLENSYACYCPDGYFRPTSCPPLTTTTRKPITLPPTTTTTTTTKTTSTTKTSTTSLATLICDPNPCFNGGACTPNGCICPSGFSGKFCEIYTVSVVGNLCSGIECVNGNCTERQTGASKYAYCECNLGFTGARCDIKYFSCEKNGRFTDSYGCSYGRYFECVYVGENLTGFPNGILYRRNCPPGLRYNPKFDYCDYASNVTC